MSFTLTMRPGAARLAQRMPQHLTKSLLSASLRGLHQAARPTSRLSILGRGLAAPTKTPLGLARAGLRTYRTEAPGQAPADGSAVRKLLVGGAIFGGTLIAINAVFNRETREDGGMPPFEREYLNNTFLHTGLGIGIIGLTARQMVRSGFVYRLMVTNPWVVALGGLGLSFATMIGTRSISPDK